MTITPTRERHAHRRRRRLLTVRARLMLVAAVSITALLGFVVVDALGDWEQQTNLRNDSATGELGGEASLPLFMGAQAERKLTAAYLADPGPAAKKALDKQRAVTDEGVVSFRRLSGTELEVGQRHKWAYVERVYDTLDRLDQVRDRADAGTSEVDEVTGYYTELLATMVEFYQALSTMDDAQLTVETRPLVGLFWASEAFSQEDALIAQARASGRMSAEHRRAFAQAYGSQRVMYERWIAPYLPPKDRKTYDQIMASSAWHTVERIEKDLIDAPTGNPSGAIENLPRSLSQWDQAYGQVYQQFGKLNLSRTQGLLAHGYARANEIRTAVYLKVGISLGIVVALAFLIFGIIRSITARLRALQDSTEETAQRLPTVVERLQQGEPVNVEAEFPRFGHGGDEFAGLAIALASAQHTAVQMASAQAADRRGFAGFVVATSGRALNLVEKQLDLLTALEHKYGKNAPVLSDFIAVDHRGGVVRRHLDNLQTLAGGHQEPYTEPKPLADVVFDAAAESDDPKRVQNKIRATVWVQAKAVNALMHVLSALLDNALTYSQNNVMVTSLSPVHGTAVEIEDMGTGMSDEEYAQANAMLDSPLTFEDMSEHRDGRLGLFVVGRLARLYGLRVSLRPGDYGGAKAVVLIPAAAQCPAPAAAPPVRPTVAPHPAATRSDGRAQLPTREMPRQQATASRPLPAERPQPPHHSPAPALQGSDGECMRTDDRAPQLPKRSRGAHMAQQLARPAAALPVHDPMTETHPETVGSNWGAWQHGTRAAEKTTTEENTPR